MADTLLSLRMQHDYPGNRPSGGAFELNANGIAAAERTTAALDLHFSLTRPWSVLFGPSGAGKSTVLRAIAGLLRPRAARVSLRSRVLTDTATNVFVPPHQRRIGFVGQHSTLFPHLSIVENVRFGVRSMHGSQGRAQAMLALFHASQLARRLPHHLSGGETQRVLLARALATSPELLLLDEPFSALDLTLREAILADLQLYLRDHPLPVLSVTHDVAEVFTLDADVLVMESGRIRAQGGASDVLAGQREHLLRILG